MSYIEIGYARFDPSISRIHGRHFQHKPGYLGAMIYCLQKGDFESAQLIRDRNERSAELIAVRDSQITLVKAIDAGKRAA